MRLPHCSLLLAAAALPAASLTAQASFTVPSRHATAPGNHSDLLLAWSNVSDPRPIRLQCLWSTADVPVASANLTAITLRRSHVAAAPNPAGTLTLRADLALGPNAPATASATFANNLGPQVVRVFDQAFALPAAPPLTGSAPAPWSVRLPFTAPVPFARSAGKGLVVDFTVTDWQPAGPGSWLVDAQQADVGARAANGPPPQDDCRFHGGALGEVASYRLPHLGGRWSIGYRGLPANASGVGALGLQGGGATWLGLALPLELTPLGAAGCTWSVAPLLLQPLAATRSGDAAWPDVPVPSDPQLAGTVFFDQSAWLAPQANPLGVVTLQSWRWTIGDNLPPDGAKVYRLQDQGAPSGVVAREAVIARFEY